jgi:dihydroorotase
MFGSDSAPHTQENKESANWCCGCFTAPIALQALVEIFEYFWHLDKLQNFVSQNAQDIYWAKMQVIPDRFVELKRKWFIVPETYWEWENRVVPFLAGKELAWSTDTK